MMDIPELQAWLFTLNPDNAVAVSEGGLSLVEIDENGKETGAYIEIGGAPVEGEDEDAC